MILGNAAHQFEGAEGVKTPAPVGADLPAVFFLLHVSYGWGTVVGLVRLPFWKAGLGSSAAEQIEYVKECVRNKPVKQALEVEE